MTAVIGGGLAVGFPTVADAHHTHFSCVVVDLVDDTKVSDADAPVTVRTGKFAAAVRTWIVGQRPKRLSHTREDGEFEAPQTAFSSGFEKNGVHGARVGRRGR
jgi:hypothetical protein